MVIFEGILILDVSKMHFSSKLNSKIQIIFKNKFPQLKEIESQIHIRIVSAHRSSWLVVFFMAIQSQHQHSKYLYKYGSPIAIPLDTAIKSESSCNCMISHEWGIGRKNEYKVWTLSIMLRLTSWKSDFFLWEKSNQGLTIEDSLL